ncbi:branched-chain amino acid ABC transporter permease [Nocardioides carbamazepini]|uniref:branched-chain amino acid ABC transporter permease n=1 Tax=Nocardioides carbamazepini TaxID=2854259 RepID=UPI00214A4FC2|nr:branched-chain amino acid ABC transporter permease [Nocardioides carbamazepini]MCR1784904.1 branched-chain amino acid ABC transporter permease [Nocardioides carbamazepini]
MDLQVLVSGALASCLYATLALSYFLIVRATRLVNFAVGGYGVFAGIGIAYLVARGWPTPGAVVAGLLAAVVLAVATELIVVRVMERRQSGLATIEIAIVAVLFVIEQGAGLLFGRQPSLVITWLDGGVRIGDTRVPHQALLTVALTLAVFGAVAWWLSRARFGRMLRAVGDNPGAAEVLGLPVARVRTMGMVVAGLAAGVAGVLATTQSALTVEAGTSFTLLGFIALVLGGTAHVWAPLAGGALLGFLEALSARVLGNDVRDYMLLALVLVVFTFRPKGLFAVKERT